MILNVHFFFVSLCFPTFVSIFYSCMSDLRRSCRWSAACNACRYSLDQLDLAFRMGTQKTWYGHGWKDHGTSESPSKKRLQRNEAIETLHSFFFWKELFLSAIFLSTSNKIRTQTIGKFVHLNLYTIPYTPKLYIPNIHHFTPSNM